MLATWQAVSRCRHANGGEVVTDFFITIIPILILGTAKRKNIIQVYSVHYIHK